MRLFCLILFSQVVVEVRCQFDPHRQCFCKVGQTVDSCRCDGLSIDEFNNCHVYPKLQKLLQKDFFRFYKVNMDKACPFWSAERQCISKECGIGYCDDEVPSELKNSANIIVIRSPANGTFLKSTEEQVNPRCEQSGNHFDPLDTTLSEDYREQLRDMDWHDDNENKFCDAEDEDPSKMHYVDLLRNPERYTGYKGSSAEKVWGSIYQENCFKPNMKFDKNFLLHPNADGMCLEKRVFYKLISGFHSAITISIAANCYNQSASLSLDGNWYRNVDMFNGRFGTKWSWEGPERLKNVYFAYILELRALAKVSQYLGKELFYTGNAEEDISTRSAVEEFMNIIKAFQDAFDESEMFTGSDAHARQLREEFRMHFHNVSRIMDCVDCDKCRLWGKVQTHGMGTALKILFSDLPHSYHRDEAYQIPFQLTRNEVVSLFQSFGRFSSSIHEVNEFRCILSSGESSTCKGAAS